MHISDSSRNGARGRKHLLFLKYKALVNGNASLWSPLTPLLGEIKIRAHFFL